MGMRMGMREKTPSQEGVSIQFRKATIDDIQTLLKLENSIAGTHTYSAMLTESEWLEAMDTEQVFLIEQDGVVIGNLSYEIKNDDHVYISGLLIHPDHQGKGYGRQTLVKVLTQFPNVSKIDLVTHPDNPARLLYESLGFVVTERKENYFGDGEPRLVLELFQK